MQRNKIIDMTERLENLKQQAKDIVGVCQVMLNDTSCKDPNRFVIKVIRREFEEILESLNANGKLLLTHRKRPVGSLFTILDSADLNFDRDLLNKIEEFKNLSNSVDESLKIYRYN